MTSPQTTWLDKARSLTPIVEKFRDESERERHVARPVLDAILDSGFLRMMAPKALGGDETAFEETLEVFEEFGRQDGSVGWNATFAIVSPMFSDYLPEHVAREVFGAHDAIVGGSFAPRGQARQAPGGFHLSGRWAFGSGCQDSTWIIGGGIVMTDAGPVLGADGSPDRRLFLFPASECRFFDTWYTAGMRGTASNDFQVEDVFIPEERSFPFAAFLRGATPRPGRAYARPLFELVPQVLAAVGLGIARDAIDSLATLAVTKTATAATSTLANDPIVHDRVGRAEATLRAARAYLFDMARQVSLTPEGGPSQVVAARLASVYAAQNAAQAVNLMYEAGGGTSIYASSRLERCFRDINTLTHHFLIAPVAFADAGRALLGGDRQTAG